VAYDMILRRQTRRNWARSSSLFPSGTMGSDSATLPTEPEKQFLAQVAVLKLAAASGHKGAKNELRNVAVKVLQVRGKAAAGDPKAGHFVEVLRDSKIFAGPGSSTPFTKR
jgi:hypothetical protein